MRLVSTAAALLSVLLWAVGSAAPARYTVGTITMPGSDHNHVELGLLAALREANRAGGIDGVPLDLQLASAVNATELHALYNSSTFLGTVKPTVYATATALQYGAQYDAPTVDPFALQGALFMPGAERSLHIRSEFDTEVAQLLNFGINGRPQCNVWFIGHMMVLDVDTSARRMRDTIVALGLPEPYLVPLPSRDSTANAVTALAAATTLNATAPIPDCYAFFTGTETTRVFVQNMTRNATLYDPHAPPSFFTNSFVSPESWRNDTGSGAPYATMYNSRVYPHELDRSYVFIQRYQAAVEEAWANATLQLPRVAVAKSSSTLAAYVAGRFFVEAVRRTRPGQLRPAGVTEAIYRTRLFTLDDFVLGPYSKGCVGALTNASGPCYCNSGMRKVFMVAVDGSTGHTQPLLDDPARGEQGVATRDIPASECALRSSFLRPLSHVLALADTAAAAAPLASQRRAQTALQARVFTTAAAQRDSAGRLLSPIRRDFAGAPTAAEARRVLQRYRPVALLLSAPGVAASDAVLDTPLTLAPMRYEWLEEQPAPVPFAQWDPRHVSFWPAIADLGHAAAVYLASQGRLGRTTAVVDSARLAALITASAHTYGVELPQVRVVPASARASRTAAAAWLRAAPPTSNGAVVVLSQAPAVVQGAQDVAGDRSAAPVVLATSEFVLEDSLLPSVPANVLFVSGLDRYSVDGKATSTYGVVLADLAAAFTALGSNTTERVRAMYRAHTLVSPLLSLRALRDDPCTAESQTGCQVSKGLGELHVRPLAGALDAYRVLGSALLPDTAPRYTALPSSTKDVTLVAVVASVVGALLAAVVAAAIVYLCCFRAQTRDNKTAPKDASQPFAMVFTDIQASTMHWAQAPQHMGPALDTHHAILRRLVSQHKGYEVKTIGDSFMVAFHDVGNAVRFGLAVQDALYDHDWGTALFDATYREVLLDYFPEAVSDDVYATMWNGLRVRVGVHFGEGSIKFDETSKGYDYYGTVVNTAARVEGVAHGGQVLVTGDAMAQLSSAGVGLPNSVVVEDLGPQPLRGLDEPVRLHQLSSLGLKGRQYPPLRLEVEREVDGSDSNDGTAEDTPGRRDSAATKDSGRTCTSASASAEGIASLVARHSASGATAAQLLQQYRVVQALLSTSPAAFRQQTIRQCAERWRVHDDPPGPLRRVVRGNKAAAADVMLLRLVDKALASAATLTLESDAESEQPLRSRHLSRVESSLHSNRRRHRSSVGQPMSATPVSAPPLPPVLPMDSPHTLPLPHLTVVHNAV